MEEDQVTSARDKVISIPEILANLFGFLTLPDLKSVRSVSTLWREVSAPILQRRAWITFIGSKDKEMTRFLQDFATTPMAHVFFRNYKLWLYHTRFEGRTLTAFLEKLGPSMQIIEIFSVIMEGVDIRDILFNFCPNLKSIRIRNCTFGDTIDRVAGTVHEEITNVRVNKSLTSLQYSDWCEIGMVNDLPFSWEEIFTAYPNLMDLEFVLSALWISSILEAARCLKIKKPSYMQLQRLRITFGMYTGVDSNDDDDEPNEEQENEAHAMDHIYSLQLVLKELSIQFNASGVNTQKFARLLHQQMNVKKLTLCGDNGEQDGILMPGFPFEVQFNQLRYLKISDNISDSLGFLSLMPNLSTLKLYYSSTMGPKTNVITRTDFSFTEMPLQTKLTTLKIDYKISSPDVKKLVFWFPGVVKAELHLDNKSFRSVCRKWTKLEELKVLGVKLTTEGITGIYELKLRNSKPSSDDIPQIETNQMNITCLTNLRRFIMRRYRSPVGVDDACVDHGFMKLPHLNYLDICSNHISDDGWTKLLNWTQLLTLKASNGDRDWEGAKTFSK